MCVCGGFRVMNEEELKRNLGCLGGCMNNTREQLGVGACCLSKP